MSDLKKHPIPKFRWHIATVSAIVLAVIRFGIGWSLDPKPPNDRVADILIPTSIFLTAGPLIGYVTSLVVYRRFNWFEAIVSFGIPPIC